VSFDQSLGDRKPEPEPGWSWSPIRDAVKRIEHVR